MISGRAATLIFASLVGGSIIGGFTAFAITPIGLPFGAAFGAIIGLAMSPAVIGPLRRKPFPAFILGVFLPALLIALIASLARDPIITMLSVITYAVMPSAVALLTPDVIFDADPDRCLKCGYEVLTLKRCPECGSPAPASRASKSRPARPVHKRSHAAFLIFLGFLIPLTIATLAAYERQRPKSNAELVRQLGANDIELRSEAQKALARQGLAALRPALTHPDANIRAAAALALGSVRDPAARAVILQMMDDPNPMVSSSAGSSLTNFDFRNPAPRR